MCFFCSITIDMLLCSLRAQTALCGVVALRYQHHQPLSKNKIVRVLNFLNVRSVGLWSIVIKFTRLVEAMTTFKRLFVLFCCWHMYMHLYMSIGHRTAPPQVVWLCIASVIENLTAKYILLSPEYADFKQASTNHKAITKIDAFSQMYWITAY